MFGSHGGSTEKSIKSQSRINGRSDTYESYRNKNHNSNNNLNNFNNYTRSNSNNNSNQNGEFASKWNAKITTPSKNSSYSSARHGLLSTPMTAPASRRSSSLFQSPAPGYAIFLFFCIFVQFFCLFFIFFIAFTPFLTHICCACFDLIRVLFQLL